MVINEWDQRQLCPDGACTGLIGPDGTCKVCGRVASNWGEERQRGLAAVDDQPAEHGGHALEAAPNEWTDRRLCSDEACIGVIGPTGHCKLCGKLGTPAGPA